MGVWQIKLPYTMKIMLYELKRVVNGEFMQNLEISGQIAEVLNIDAGTDSAVD